MAKTDIEKVLTIFHGISAGDVDLATQYIDHKRFVQHHCCPGKLARGWRKRLIASEISRFDAGNDLKADAPLVQLD